MRIEDQKSGKTSKKWRNDDKKGSFYISVPYYTICLVSSQFPLLCELKID